MTQTSSPRQVPPWMRAARPVEKSMNFGTTFKRLMRRLVPERLRLMLVLVSAVTAIVLNVVGPKILGHATDIIFNGAIGSRLPANETKQAVIANMRAHGQGALADALSRTDVIPGVGINFHKLADVLLLVLALYVLSAAFSFVQGIVLTGVTQRTIRRLRSDVEDKLNALPLAYFDKQPRGEILSRVTNDIDNVAQSLQQALSQSLTSLLTVLGVLVMMISISPLLSIVALVTVPLSLVVTRLIAKRSQPMFVQQWAATGELNGKVEEAFSGHELIKLFGRSAEVEREFENSNERVYVSSFRSQFISGTIMPSLFFLGNLNYVLLAVVGALRVSSGALTVGQVQAFVQYSRQFTQPLSQLASMSNTIQSGVASAERVFELLDEQELEPDITNKTANLAADITGHVEFRNVSFSYSKEQTLIRDLFLEARPGSTVAIVGHTGAGKTTIVNLIMRFYEIDAGEILLDGINTCHISRHDLRTPIGMVLQDPWLFGGTIRENIMYAKPNASPEEFASATRAANVDHFVEALPNGYETVIEDDAKNISAGEKQLLTIARAFLADPSLLILDEATSSVDSRTEVLIQRAMARLRANRTSFVVAHRLSTIRDADLILVMDAGQIVEQGTHDQLLDAKGKYYELYNAQFAGHEL